MPFVPARVRRVARLLSRAPLFTAAAVITLAVGIGATTAIFSVVYGVLLKPLPFAEPETLVGVWHTAPGLGAPLMNQSPATYFTYRDEGRTFEDIGMWDNTAVSVTGAGEPERVDALLVTDGTLGILRVQPMLGRRFSGDDDSTRTAETVMLAHAYWQRKFAGDPNIIGRQIMIDGKPRQVIGVLPAGFKFLNNNAQLVLPFRFNRAEVFIGNFSYQAVARLKPGVTIEQANADIARMIPLIVERFPLPPGFTRTMFEEVKMGPLVRPLSVDVIGDVGRVLWVLLGTVSIILLIACANVANLFLVRAEGRQQEIAVHAALGATRARIAWELLSESLTLGVLGGAAGLFLAYLGIGLLAATAPEGLPRVNEIGLDPIVILFTAGISVFAGLLFGLLPVLKFARPRLASALKEGGRLSSDGRERHRARNTLVVAEIALAVVLLVGSGLMIRTFQALRSVQPGFTNPEEVLTFRISIPESLVPDRPSLTSAQSPADALVGAERVTRTHEQILRRIEQIPGVTSAALSSAITMDGHDSNDPVFVEDFPGPAGRIPPIRRFKWVSEGLFRTMGNRIVAGRDITWAETYALHQVVMINETLAREYWRDPREAVGKRIRQSPTNPWRTIIGVVGDERDDGAARPAPAIVYWPMMVKDYWTLPVFSRRTMAYAVRTGRADSPTLLKEIQQAVWSVNSGLPLANVMTLNAIRAGSMAQTSFALVMLAIAAAVALLLGVVGIYGVIAYVATQRTREVGIRIALGANDRDVSGLFLRHGLLLAIVGVALGLGAAAATTRVMSSMLFGVNPMDPVTYAAVALGLGGTAVLASYIPARRASRIDPAVALRWEV
jgi:putative ABC transport system permease protein